MPGEFAIKEGRKYLFTITGHMVLPGTHEGQWILTGYGKKKYLLADKFYAHYKLRTGQKIRCLADKINCSGRIFLEPDHPYYTAGKKYEFPVLRISPPLDSVRQKYSIAWVQDLHGHEWPCPVDLPEGSEAELKHLTCRVDRIKKGALTVSLPAMALRLRTLKRGRNYKFSIEDIRIFDTEKFYVLKDKNGDFHRLRVEDYVHYHFKKGDSIEATVVKYNPEGECVVEPVHPYYRVGQLYPFRFVELKKSVDPLGHTEAIIFVEDIYNQPIKVKPLAWQAESEDYHPVEIQCLVQKFKKGKPVLVAMEKNPGQETGNQSLNEN